MAEAEELDVELFIEEVRKNQMLWNIFNEDFHNRTKKRIAWMGVCRVFCRGFDKQSEKCKNDICDKFKKRWRSLRDNFIKQKRKKFAAGHTSDSGRPYMYHKQLSFLNQSDSITDFQSDFENKKIIPKQEEHHQEEENHSTPTEIKNNDINLRQNHDTRKRKRDPEPPTVESLKIIDVKSLHSSSTADPNPDRLFFESILPYMAGFTEDQKLEFRCEVLNAIKRIRKPEQRDSQDQNNGYPKASNAQQSLHFI